MHVDKYKKKYFLDFIPDIEFLSITHTTFIQTV